MLTGTVGCVWILLGAGCSTGTEEQVASSAPVTMSPDPAAVAGAQTPAPQSASHEVVDMGVAEWPIWLGESVGTLTQGYEVITGRVTGIALPFDPRPGYGGTAPETAPPDNPKSSYSPSGEEINRPPGRLFTVFAVEVTDPGSTKLARGDKINVGQSAGIWEGKQYQLEGNPPLGIGQQYLMAISPSDTVAKLLGEGYFMGPPFAHFVVEGNAMHPLDPMWAGLPAVKELTGKSTEAALDTILAARAQLAAESPTPAP